MKYFLNKEIIVCLLKYFIKSVHVTDSRQMKISKITGIHLILNEKLRYHIISLVLFCKYSSRPIHIYRPLKARQTGLVLWQPTISRASSVTSRIRFRCPSRRTRWTRPSTRIEAMRSTYSRAWPDIVRYFILYTMITLQF